MAKALVLSDSHGLTKRLDDIVNRHEVDLLIHCGDSELAHDSPHVNDFVIVKGNCDWDDAFEEERIVEFEGLRIFVTHGHLYGVKSSLLKLQYRAKEVGADVVLFGHSHVAYCIQHDEQLFVNPGSIRRPRNWTTASYCILSWDSRKQVHVTFYDVDGNVANEFPFQTTFYL